MDVGCGLPRGVKWCKSEGVICPEGVNGCRMWAAKRSKML